MAKPLMVVAGVIMLFGVGFAAGNTWCSSGQQGAVQGSIDEGKEKVADVKEIIKWREKKVNVYIDRIKTVTDPSGCADAAVIPDIDDQLYEVYRLTSGSEVNRRLQVRGVSGGDPSGDTSK